MNSYKVSFIPLFIKFQQLPQALTRSVVYNILATKSMWKCALKKKKDFYPKLYSGICENSGMNYSLSASKLMDLYL